MILRITEAKYLGEYNVLFTFSNGARKKVDMSVLFRYPAYKVLEDKRKFVQFGLRDTIYWNNGLDVAPEFLYGHGVDVI